MKRFSAVLALALMCLAGTPAHAADGRSCTTIEKAMANSQVFFPGSTAVKMNPIEAKEFVRRLVKQFPQPEPTYLPSNLLVLSLPSRIWVFFFKDDCYKEKAWLSHKQFEELMGDGV